MKIKVTYEKAASGEIIARLEVMAKEDFPCLDIFLINEKISVDEEVFSMRGRETDVIYEVFVTGSDAIRAATRKIVEIKHALEEWRAILTPGEVNHEL